MPKCVVAEDESLLREDLVQQLLQIWPALEIVAACEDGGSALDAIAQYQPEVVFLDIRMPGLSGLDVAAAMAEVSPRSQIVFVTAYNQYAIDAFEKGAVDYLLKPISDERLLATVKRLQSRGNSSAAEMQTLNQLLQQLRASPETAKPAPLVWITASSGNETKLIMVDDIAYFQADSKYTVVMTAEGEALLRKPIRDLLQVLDNTMFKQIHRSTIVNMRAIAGISRDDSGKGMVKLKNRPETLSVSQPFMTLFKNM